MARKPETTFYQSVHRHMSPRVYRMKLHNAFLSGPADSWYSGPSSDLWVEWKYLVLPKRSSTLVKAALTPLQEAWLRDRHLEGRNIAVIVGCPEGGVIFRDLSWETPLECGAYRTRLQPRKDLAAWIEGFVCRGFDGSQPEQQPPIASTVS